jgi:phage baseplate assembly protein W
MENRILGAGWKFPVKNDLQGNLVLSRGEEDIKEAIWIILSTSRGERMMRPEFGCGIHDLVFSPINAGTLRVVEATIRETLTEFEPRIEVLTVEASDKEADQGRLLVSINYRVIDTNYETNLVFPFYLKEGRG